VLFANARGGFSGSGVVASNASPIIDFNIITANRRCDGVVIQARDLPFEGARRRAEQPGAAAATVDD
jgi:hypothetical protein